MHARDEQSRLRAVVDTAVDGVILINARGIILMFNPACEKLFGYAAYEVIGRNVKMLMPEPYQAEHDDYLANYRETGVRKIIGIGREVLGRRKDSSTFPMDLSVGEASQQGESIFVGIIHDLTARKRTEEQLAQAQKMEVVGQLSGGIAHDFNNLLTVILGNAEALSLRLKARDDLKQLADAVVASAERGADLTQRLLAFSRRQMLQPSALDCNALVDRMQVLLRRMMREDIAIRLVLSQTPINGLADAAQLENALLNLALNAQDAMPQGGTLTLITERVELEGNSLGPDIGVRPGPYAMICVADDGCGMDRETLTRVFEPFFTTKEVGKGSGLGLSMVYGFAKQSNGHVTIYSEPGLGTSVRLYLPEAETPAVAQQHSRAADVPTGTELILVVEDDPWVRNHTVSSLESLGYEVAVASNGHEALSMLNSGTRPALLFTDVVMPGELSGWELGAKARERISNLRVLYTSGYPKEALTGRGRFDQHADLLSKPYRLGELARRVRDKLDRLPD